MSWQKLGNIFTPQDHGLISHAQVPTVSVGETCINIFFSSRNKDGKSLPYKASFSLNDPTKILSFSNTPLMSMGLPGTFDDDGVMPGEILQKNDELLMYYSGWNQRTNVPYHNATGLAKSTDGGDSFQRVFQGPIMDRTATEPYLAVTPSIIVNEHGYKMWYVSGVSWEKFDGKYEPIYVIKYAHSMDGVNWQRNSAICIKQNHLEEAFSHPTVIYENGLYQMWYCYRGSRNYRDGKNSYRIGYATSSNGIDWQREDDKNIISPSENGWDSKMICYPYVFYIGKQRYMVYNGNGFGQTGYGLAKWEKK